MYFQSTQPPTSGTGVKEGDQWFDTAHNNAQYVLIKQTDGSLKWILASDANDKIANGRIVLNGNTTVNGDFKVNGRNIILNGDTTVDGTFKVGGGNVELNGNTSVTGVLEVFGNKGIISYNGNTEASSTRRIVIQSGAILFQRRS